MNKETKRRAIRAVDNLCTMVVVVGAALLVLGVCMNAGFFMGCGATLLIVATLVGIFLEEPTEESKDGTIELNEEGTELLYVPEEWEKER